MARVSSVGGQAVMEGVMMKSPTGVALAVRRADGTIATRYDNWTTKAKKGTFLGLPIVRGVVTFIETLSTGMNTLTESAKLAGEDIEEEPTKFEKWLSEKLGKSVESIVIGLAVILAIALSVGLFFLLPLGISSLIFGKAASVAGVWKSLTEGLVRLIIFIGYLLLCSRIKDVKRTFMYHGAEHKTIACYEAEEELTPENAAKHSRLHPRCGTNYLFLVMAVSILFFAAIGWNASFAVRLAMRIAFLPVVAGLSYEVLRLAARYDNWFTRIIRAPGMALQRITTKEPTPDMLEVAIAAFNLAMDPNYKVEAEAAEGSAQSAE
ncbi:MAG: DUF1385 domain-containing protein [Clostridium sp.]|nr:DUF1385 domain-containing protein [Clostridium sp.]